MEEPGLRPLKEERPLFIPLMTVWFRAFESGEKNVEYRGYGPRWNERTCRIGRLATLAHGYGHPRLSRVVTGFKKLARHETPQAVKQLLPGHEFYAAIELALQESEANGSSKPLPQVKT